jgi:DNA-binding transcriptional LysR family regulator
VKGHKMTTLPNHSDPKTEHEPIQDKDEIDWTSLQILAETAYAVSLRDAARRSKLSMATIIRHLERLERSIGQPVYKRNGKLFLLTNEGKELQELALEVRDIIKIHSDKIRDTPQYRISLSMDNVVNEILPRYNSDLFYDLIAEYNVNINNFVDRKEAFDSDIILSVDRFNAFNANVVRLCTIGFCTFASIEYITAHGIPRSRESLKDHSFGIFVSKDRLEFPEIEQIASRAGNTIFSNSQNIIMKSVLKGKCIGVLPIYYLEKYKRIIPIDIGFYKEKEIWMYIKKESKYVDKIGSLIKEVRNCFDERRFKFLKHNYSIFS